MHQSMEHKSLGQMSAMKWCVESTYAAYIPIPGVFFAIYLYLLLHASLIIAAFSSMASVLALSAIGGVFDWTCVAIEGALGPCMLRSWAHFSFSGPHLFPKTFFANQPLICHLPPSHMVPRSTTYPPGLPCHPSSPLATPNPVIRPIGNFTVISLLFSILRP